MAELKTKKNDASVENFLASIENEQRRKDAIELNELMTDWLQEEPKMWGASIVGFGNYHYVYASGREGDWMKAGFSPRKENLTVYVMAGFDEYAEAAGYDPRPYLEKLGPYSTGKSCLYIKKLADINLDALRDLVVASYSKIQDINNATN